MGLKAIFELFRDSFKDWSEDKASRLGASLAYYTMFSLGPLLVIAIAIASFIFGEEASRGQIVGTISGIVGQDASGVIEQTIENANQGGTNIVATIIGIATLLLGASGVFGQLKDALNTIWEVEPKPNRGIMATIKERFFSFTMVLGTGFLLLVSLVITAAVAAVGTYLQSLLPGSELLWQIVNFVVSLGVIVLMFALLYKYLPDVRIGWSDVWIGALFTAVLFTLGQFALSFYLSSGNPGKSFGAAGSVIIVLVWIYYSAQIFFFGAEFTQVYTNQYGSRVRPEPNAQFVTEEARAQQGMSPEKPSDRKDGGKERKEAPRAPVSEGTASPWFK